MQPKMKSLLIVSIISMAFAEDFINSKNCGQKNSTVLIKHTIDDIQHEICYGHRIHPKAILTAAHCVYDTDEIDLQIDTVLGENGQIDSRNVSDVILQPDYSPCNEEDNLAILIVDPPFDDNFGTICLVDNAVNDINVEYKNCAIKANSLDQQIDENEIIERCHTTPSLDSFTTEEDVVERVCDLMYLESVNALKYSYSNYTTCLISAQKGSASREYLTDYTSYAIVCSGYKIKFSTNIFDVYEWINATVAEKAKMDYLIAISSNPQ